MPDRTKYSDFNRVVEIDNIQYEEEGTYECTAKRKSSVASKEVVLAIECTSKLLILHACKTGARKALCRQKKDRKFV